MKNILKSVIAVSSVVIAVSTVSFTVYAAPTSYSSVDRGFITSVKDQGDWGTCWSFSSTAVSEASLIKEFPEKYTSNTLDLSENLQAYMASHPNLYGYKGLSADTATYSGEAEDYLLAGASMLSPGLLYMNGYGPYAESEEYPYSSYGTPSIAYENFTEAEYYKLRDSGIAKATAMYEVKLNKNNDNEKVKQLIMDQGAAMVSYYEDYEYLTYDANRDFYYYCPVSNTYNHGVAIVGWDDTIPASAFNSAPEGDGAWLIKNSYGTNSRNGGYFWLSYYDKSLSSYVYSYDFTLMGEDDYYDYSYSYDGSNSYKEVYYPSSSSIYSANIFTSEYNMSISGAAFYAAEGSIIDVSIYSGVTDSIPTSGTKVASKTVSAYYGGYISCMFDKEVEIDEGVAFSIVIKATNTNEAPSVYIEKAVNMHGTTRTADVAKGQSFFSQNGTSWTDSYSKGGNVMIKALAVEEICSHSFGGWTFTEEPTCTKAGRKERTCLRCKMVESVGVRSLGHDYSDSVVDPTCTAQGYTLHICSRCYDSYKDTYTNATGHSFGDWTTTKKATCTEDGKKERSCSYCKAVDSETINALGHSYTEDVVDPTCTAQGYTLHTCSRCYDSYKDTYPNATGHSFGDWTTTKNATCTEEGEKERNCSFCETVDTETINALGHSYQTEVIAPTYTEQGYTLNNCSVCGDSYKDNYTDKLVLPAVTGLKIAPTSSSSVTLRWDKNDNATGYIIQQYKNGEWTHIKQLARNTVLSYTATGLTPSTTYQFRIRAYVTENSATAYSEFVTISGTTNPTNISGVKAASTANSVTISWDKNDSATGYFIQQYKNGAWTHVRQLARNTATTFTASGLTPSTKYQYRIRAYYTSGDTTVYGEYKYVSPTTRPNNMTGIKASSTANSITFSWDKNSSATGYFVQQYKNGAWTHVRQLARNTATTFTASGLNPSTKYQYRIRAYYTDGTSTAYSNYFTLAPTTRPNNLTGIKASSTANSVTISWDKVDSATGYFVQQYKNGAWTHVRQLARNTATTYTATGLIPSTKYQYRIRAYYTDGTTTTYSDYKYVSPTTRPTNLTGVKVTSTTNTVTLSWDKNNSATGYFVQQYKNGAWTHVRQLARNTVTTYTATGLTPSTTYQFRIRAYYTDGSTTTYSDYTTVSGTTNPADMSGVKISATTSGTITISWDKNDSATGYFIQQYKNGEWTHIRQLARNTVLSYTATGLASSTTYQFRIRAYNVVDDTTLYSPYTTISGVTTN